MPKRSSTGTSAPKGAPVIVDLDNLAVRECVGNVDALMCWEELRGTGRALTVKQVAEAQRISVETAQRVLDLLVEAAWVERVKAGGGRRSTSYRAAGDTLMVGWDPTSPHHQGVIRNVMAGLRSASRRVIDSQQAAPVRLRKLGVYFTFQATREDAHKIMDAINDLAPRIRQADARAKRLLASAGRNPIEKSVDATKDIATYHVGSDLQELQRDVSAPMPELMLFDYEAIRRMADARGRSPEHALSAKELEVAERLSAGESREEIAKALGRSMNTILTHCKRIYMKLGVHNRAELTARMKSIV
jgi:DNA-binding CsgD family transcriptional regulator